MGLNDANTSSIPLRPKFSWDAKTPPWTDGKGNQERFKVAVEDWKDFHDTLPENSPNKISAAVQGIILKSQLYGQAADQCSELTKEQLKSENGVQLIINAVYRRDFMSVISEAYDGFSILINTRRNDNESLKEFETRFSAAVSKFNSFSTTTKLPQCITALLLLINASIEHSQRVSALSAAAPAGTVFNDQASNDDFLKVVTYNQVSSIVKQCEKSNTSIISANAGGPGGSRLYNPRGRRQPSIAVLKQHPCHKCGKYGHWKPSHLHDGSLPSNVKSFDTSEEFENSLGKSSSGHKDDDQETTSPRKTISFNMAIPTSPNSYTTKDDNMYGPLVDDGAEYSAIGTIELKLIFNVDVNEDLDNIPNSLQGHTHWQYGQGAHASDARQILGSTVLSVKADSGTIINIRHVVVEGSSQCVIGRNVTSLTNLIHIEKNAIEFISKDGTEYISMVSKNRLSYIPITSFNGTSETNVLKNFNVTTVNDLPWIDVKRIVDKVHKHVCGHSNLTDIRMFLERNNIWNNAVEKYVNDLLKNCRSCKSTAPPQPSRKVSISSMSKGINETVCIDHLYLEGIRLFHVMDLVTRFSSAFVVSDATMKQTINAFEACWASQFWIPEQIKADTAFINSEFEKYCKERHVKLSPIPPKRHSRIAIESKHGIIRSVFLKLKDADPSESHNTLAIRAVTISNDLYGNDILSSFEQAKGFTKPVTGNSPNATPKDIIEAQEKLTAKRKLALILKSKATFEEQITVGDLIEVYQNTGMNKKGVWSTPKIVLAVDPESRTVTVPGKSGHKVTVAVEDIRLALPEESFAETIQISLDKLNESIEDELYTQDDTNQICEESKNCSMHEMTNSETTNQHNNVTICNEDADFSGSGINAESIDTEQTTHLLKRGDQVEVFWPLDDTFYSGTVKHMHNNGEITVLYDDGGRERLNMDNEKWNYSANQATASSGISRPDENPEYAIEDIEPRELDRMFQYFGNKPFLRFQSQGFHQFILSSAYKNEEQSFLKTVEVIPKDKLPLNANIIRSHTLYKIKVMMTLR